jgi:hypothetical protein
MHCFQNLFFAAILALMTTSYLCAQENVPRSYSFTALSWDQPIRDLHYFDGSQWQEITITNAAKTLPRTVRLLKPVILFYNEIPSDEANASPVATARFPAETPEAMFLFFPVEQAVSQERYNVRSLADGVRGYPPGSYRFINFSANPMAGSVGGETFQLDPGAERVLQPRDLEDGSVVFQYASFAGEKWEVFYRSHWSVRKDRRTIVFFLENPDQPGKLSMRRIYEAVPLSEPTSARL